MATGKSIRMAALSNPTAIPSNSDLNTYTKAGCYGCASSSVAGTYSNCPVTSAFAMLVLNKANGLFVQVIFAGSNIYARNQSSGGWDYWYKYTGTRV